MVMEYAETVDFLASKAGILPEFEAEGGIYQASAETKKALLKALKMPAGTAKEAEKTLQDVLEKPFRRTLPPVVVARMERGVTEVIVTVPSKDVYQPVSWEICLESGKTLSGQKNVSEMAVRDVREVDGRMFEHRAMVIEVPQELGYHTLRLFSEDGLPQEGCETSLIVVPSACYMPECMKNGAKPWGFPLQLYALRSKKNWGIGDFSDLKAMNAVAAAFGADVIGINPINVAFMARVETASPYYSSCRLFLNPLYIDVNAVPEAGACAALQKYMKTKTFKDKLEKARASRLVDYTLVAKLKEKAFEFLFEDFKTSVSPERRQSFDAFCREGGHELNAAAVYQVLAEYFVSKKKSFGFKSWGKKYASPDSPEVLKFAEKNADRVMYYKYLFWLADEQFQAASDESKKQGLGIGLYQDLAVGVAAESAETWGAQDLFATDLSIGSPPDMFNANGQEWGVAPMRPEAMRCEAYATYRKVLHANMKRAGAVRIDHVMGLVRLFCIPQGEKGAYLSYPLEDMIGIVALESHRCKCLVVGEDLGVVPSFFREVLAKTNILSFRVFRYEQSADGRYYPLERYPETALVAAGTHDMPTLPGYWLGTDIDAARDIGLFADHGKYEQTQAVRMRDRYSMVESLSRTGRWFVTPESFEEEISGKKIPPHLTEVLYAYLAGAPCRLLLAQLEDILGQVEQMNMPGTNSEYPNWRYKLPKTVEQLYDDENMKRICGTLKRLRNT